MIVRRILAIVLFSLVVFVAFIGVAECQTDGNPAVLWTTDKMGLKEIDDFNAGDEVYVKTADDYPGVNYPIMPGKYKIYVLQGDVFKDSGKPAGMDYPKSLTNGQVVLATSEVTTDPDGRFGNILGALPHTKSNPGWAMPVKALDSAPIGDFTIVLDQLMHYRDGKLYKSPGVGEWNSAFDYRDDACNGSGNNLHVVPEGETVVLAGAMLGALGCFTLIRRKKPAIR